MLFLVFACIVTLAKASSVCYKPYGCFTNAAPFNNFMRKLPQSPRTVATKFYLHTRASGTAPEKIIAGLPKTIRDSKFKASKKTVFIVHGWLESKSVKWIAGMVKALLKRGDMNVIVTGWSGGSRQSYSQAAGNCRLVGKQISYLIKKLHYGFGLKPSSVHLIGFSLGGQIVGYAGRNLRKSSLTVRRITGLDPASPLFERYSRDVRLEASDAEFVDVIHTNTFTLLIARVGTRRPSGHIDFYPNGGSVQPGCLDVGKLISGRFFACSHMRAPKYFTDTINSECPFTSYPCGSYSAFARGSCTSCPPGGCPKMGYDALKYSKSAKGKFYLLTAKKKPFCVYHYKISFKTGNRWWAGLFHSRIRIKLYGSNAKTRKIWLPARTFLSGSTESFVIGLTHKLGSLKDIDVAEQGNSWYLERVTVKEIRSGKSSTINFHSWVKK